MTEFIEAKDSPTGSRAQQVALLMEALQEHSDLGPAAFDELCAGCGIKYPQDVQAAMHALEIAGAIKRYTYVESGTTRKRVAYQINPDGGSGPTPAASTKRSSRQPSSGKQKRARRSQKEVSRKR